MSLAEIHALFARPDLPWPIVTCKSCPARIVWTETDNAKPMPVDAAGDPAGNVIVCEPYGLFGDAEANVPASRSVPKGEPPWDKAWRAGAPPAGELRSVSHFATCPNAPQHRKARP